MTLRRAGPLLALTITIMILIAYVPSGAADDNRVALVIDYGNGQVAKRCVSFPEESISGFEALERSGLPVETDFQTGGTAICRIDSQGCPSTDCFCACRGGGDCIYWSYWHQINGVWSYSAAGSGLYQVSHGAIEGWVWGPGSVTQASAPPLVSFADVCTTAPADTPTSTVTPSPTSMPIILPTALPTIDNPLAVTTAPTSAAATVPATLPVSESPAATSGAPVPTAAAGSSSSPEADPQSTAISLATQPPSLEAGKDDASPLGDTAIASSPEFEGVVLGAAAEDEDILTPAPDATNSHPTIETTRAIGEPVGGLVDNATPASEESSSSPPVAVAVVGENVVSGEAVLVMPVDDSSIRADWISYAGFAGLLLLLGALSLVIYRGRAGAK